MAGPPAWVASDLEESMVTWLSRGLAGHVTDKDWAAFLGERNSGKSALIGALEQAFGSELVDVVNRDLCWKV